MELSNQQALLIGALGDHPGYVLLRDYMQARCEDVLMEIAAAETDEKERRAVAVWRTYQKLLVDMDGLVSSFTDLARQSRDQALGVGYSPTIEVNEKTASDLVARLGGDTDSADVLAALTQYGIIPTGSEEVITYE